MHVLFVEPAFPHYQRDFVRALHKVGARVTAIGEASPESLPRDVRAHIDAYEQIPCVTDENALYEVVRRVQQREWVDRLEATIEAHILPAAHVREATDIPGTTPKTAYLCRDKPAMKQVLREAGVPCARSLGTSDPDEVRAFVSEVGFPVILKPRSSAGAAGTYRVNDANELESAMSASQVDRGMPVAVEEFIEGHEGFYDTLCIDGQPVFDFACHYFPNVLEAMRTRWISPQILCTNRLDDPSYDEVKSLGRKVIAALEIGTSATHMEWFFGPKGLKFSEIGCRPPGVGAWDLYCAANEFDLYEEWANVIVHGRVERYPSRRYTSGMIALRPDRDGRISGYEGVEEILEKYAACVIDHHFPPPGTATQGVEHGYMANAWMRLRHPDYDTLREILGDVGRTIRVHAS